MSDALTDAQRADLESIADLLIPAAVGMPAASEIATTGKWLDRVLAADPGRLEPLRELGRRGPDDLFDTDPATFELAADAIIAAYFMHPRVRRLIGYPGQKPTLVAPDEAEHYLPLDALERVRARGPIYVPTPPADV